MKAKEKVPDKQVGMKALSIKNKIWEVRNKRNVSVPEISRLTGISESAIYNYEAHKSSPTLEQINDIAAILDVGFWDLIEVPKIHIKDYKLP